MEKFSYLYHTEEREDGVFLFILCFLVLKGVEKEKIS